MSKIKQIIIAGTLLVSVSSFAQKEELKALKKIYAKDEIKGNDLNEYKSLVLKVEPIATEESDKIYAGFYKAMIPLLDVLSLDKKSTPQQVQAQMAKSINSKVVSEMALGLSATLEYEKKSGKKIYTDKINEAIASFKPDLINYAIELGNQKKYKESADVLYSIYKLDTKDQETLYYAASYAVNDKDYTNALKYYEELKALNYTGEKTIYYAINKASQKEENFPSKDLRTTFIATGTHEKPRDEKLPSKRGEIYKNIALIFLQEGKDDEAKKAFKEARISNPEDNSLLLSEAELYLKLKDFDTYTKLVNEALEKQPNNADLVYNLGVISGNSNKNVEAEKYYRRAIEIDSNYFNAYLNLAELKLRDDKKFVDEINKLTNSEKDLKKYELVKTERNKNFASILPILEKACEIDSTNDPAMRTLLSVYKALEMTDKANALKAKLK
ncbi:tetratricopeptide repeat protein [Flavobacterium sp.]|uniref:tetratricopeptide repeat protein n=1 Tax=Flavobacterium sp. TaxID=239 RepID=UPI003750F8A7